MTADPAALMSSDRAPQLLVAPGVEIPDDAVIGANVVVHAGVLLGRGVVLEDAVLVGKVPVLGGGSKSPVALPSTTRIGDGAIIGGHTTLNAGATIGPRVYVGDHSLVREGAHLGADSSIGHACTIGRDAVVGERVRMQGYCGLATGVVVEDDCFVGPMVIVLAGITMGASGKDPSPAVLRRGSNIGSAAQILPGVEVGAGSVVGAGAVVTRDVRPGVTVVGVPARPIPPGRDAAV